jgi:hypothetical protein
MKPMVVIAVILLCGCAAQTDRGINGRWADAEDNLDTIEFFADGTVEIVSRPGNPLKDPAPQSLVGSYSVLDEGRVRIEAAGHSSIARYAINAGELMLIEADTARFVRDSPRLEEARRGNLERYVADTRVRADLTAVQRLLERRWILRAGYVGRDPVQALLGFTRPEAVTINTIEVTRHSAALELRHADAPGTGCVFIKGEPSAKARMPDGKEAESSGCTF